MHIRIFNHFYVRACSKCVQHYLELEHQQLSKVHILSYTTCLYTSAIFDLDSFFVALLVTQKGAFPLGDGFLSDLQKAEDIKAWLFLTWDQAMGSMGTMGIAIIARLC